MGDGRGHPQPGGQTGSNGGFEAIGFATVQLGWRQQYASGSNTPYTLELSVDGGERWSELPPIQKHGACEFDPVVFSTSQVAFAGVDLNQAASADAFRQTALYRTTDQGATWETFTLSTPSAMADLTAFYGLPQFSGAGFGVLPVIDAGIDGSTAVFFSSVDGGLRWTAQARLTLPALVATAGEGEECGEGEQAPGLPVIAMAGSADWWVATQSSSGPSRFYVTSDGGTAWTAATPTGLPPISGSFELYASSATTAWISTYVEETPVLYQTVDGGKIWQLVEP